MREIKTPRCPVRGDGRIRSPLYTNPAASGLLRCVKPNNAKDCSSFLFSFVCDGLVQLRQGSRAGINTPVSPLRNSQRTTEPGVRSRLFCVYQPFNLDQHRRRPPQIWATKKPRAMHGAR